MVGRGRLDVTVTPFGPLIAADRRGVDEQAGIVAAARGAPQVRVHLTA